MNVLVINGSPKGKYSITLQTCLYLEKCFPCHSFRVIDAGQRIRALEKDITELRDAVKDADLLLFSYPVYTFLAPSQLHRLIELIKADGMEFAGKFATQITTSKHFYDVTAHRYIEDNCHDMGLRVIHGLSADMEDLTTERGQREAESFMRYVAFCVDNGICEPAPSAKPRKLTEYEAFTHCTEKKQGDHTFDTVIVTDLMPDDARLAAMTEDFQSAYPYPVRTVNIRDFQFSGGCLGCFNCAGDGKCVYKDGFDSFLRESIQTADAIVYAFTVRDHSMGARFKMYDDRQFCNGHRTVTEGKPFAYIINGDYEAEPNLRTLIEARSDVGGNFLAGAAYDAASVVSTANRLAYALENGYAQPRTFYGVGGMKIFRDLIWLMRGLMKADHMYYKAHGVYDFPQKKRGQMIKMCLLGSLVRDPKIKSRMGNKMNEGMIAPYKKVIESKK